MSSRESLPPMLLRYRRTGAASMMSNAFPRDSPVAMSTMSTSVTPFSAMKNAALAPTFPLPMMLTPAMAHLSGSARRGVTVTATRYP